MRLLVSVQSPEEAAAALAGNADIIDAKDPAIGALTPVSDETFRQIRTVVNGRRPVTAAIGHATSERTIEALAERFAAAGAAFVKVAADDNATPSRMMRLVRAAVRGARTGSTRCAVIAVEYADRPGQVRLDRFASIAAQAGAEGVLLDTIDKRGPGTCQLLDMPALEQWTAAGHAHGLLVALAGKLREEDLHIAGALGIDVAGVRGAACDAGRTGRVFTERVQSLAARCVLAT